jgi:hypothetical protein
MGFSYGVTYKVKPGKKPKPEIIPKLTAWQTQTNIVLGKIPGPVKYPIRWTSERQRRAFFATNGFGRGIPTKRTGDVARWGVFVDYDVFLAMSDWTFQLKIFMATLNPLKKIGLKAAPKSAVIARIFISPAAEKYQRYVTGTEQQGFHRDTGWIYAPSIITTQVHRFEGILEDTGIL